MLTSVNKSSFYTSYSFQIKMAVYVNNDHVIHNFVRVEKVYFKSSLTILSEESLDSLEEKQKLAREAIWYAMDLNTWSPLIRIALAWNTSCLKNKNSPNLYEDSMSGHIHYCSTNWPNLYESILHYDSKDYFYLEENRPRIIYDFIGIRTNKPTRSIKEYLNASISKYGNGHSILETIKPFDVEIIESQDRNWIIRDKL